MIEIEQRLVEMPGIDMAAVIREEAGLIACYTGIREIEEDKIKKFLKDYLPAYMVPTKFIYLSEMPLNANDKIDRKALLEKVQQRATVEIVPQRYSELEEKIIAIVKEELKLSGRDILLQDKLLPMGVDSINFIKILVTLEDEFDIEFEDQNLRLENFECIKDIVNSVKSLLKVT